MEAYTVNATLARGRRHQIGPQTALILCAGILCSAVAPVHTTRASEIAQAANQSSAEQGRDEPSKADRENTDTIKVSRSGSVEMHVANLPLSTVLEALSLQSRHNIVATPDVAGFVTAHLYGVTFEEALRAVLASNGAGFRRQGNFIYVYTNDELADVFAEESPAATRIFALSFCSPRDALAVVAPMLSKSGSVVAAPDSKQGLSGTLEQSGGDDSAQRDYLAVRDRPDILEQVARTLRELDQPPPQVLVEATILAVTLDEDNAFGVDFTVVGGVDLELLGAISNAVTDLSLGQLPTNRFERFNSNISTDVSRNVPEGGLTIGVIKDKVGVFVRALDAITDTAVLANPKVLALNKQRAHIIIGRRDGYLTTTLTETQAIQNVEFLETGTQLVFRPFIGKNGLVRMELHPKDSVGTVINGLPTEQTTEVTTNVVVRDGQTILIGGLFREVTSDSRTQLPWIGNAPVIGPLFQGRSDSILRQEVIILLTVHIVKDEEAYARAGEKTRQDIERLRIGLRRNMMWHGRERQAQAHYRKSVALAAAGDTDRALWHIRMALQNDPRLLPAIELREKILGTRRWDDDGAATRDFIHRLIAAPTVSQLPQFDRPASLLEPTEGTDQIDSSQGESEDAP